MVECLSKQQQSKKDGNIVFTLCLPIKDYTMAFNNRYGE